MDEQIRELEQISNECRKTILKMIHHAKNGHVGGSLSEIDILVALYFKIMKIDPENPGWIERDRLILSKGHSSPGYYTALAKRGYFDQTLLDSFDQIDSRLQAHPDMNKCPGVDYSTGSLGQGLSVGIGIAEAGIIKNLSFTTFVLMGDGETQEGQIWEALMYAGVKQVKNLVAVFDCNKVQLSTLLSDSIDLSPFSDKLKAFRWRVVETEGNHMEDISSALIRAKEESSSGPVAVIANTVKGCGVSFMENKYQWHGKAPNDEQLELALQELGR